MPVKYGYYYSDHKKYGAKYCKCGCGEILSSYRYTYKKGCHQKGQRNPQWSGGRILKNGYIYIHMPQHPYAIKTGYIAEHRFVIEQIIGRHLKSTEIVHHINKNTQDNRPENLKLMPKIQHHSMENTLYSRENLIKQIKNKSIELKRIPFAKDFPNHKPFYRLFGSWNNALISAGFPVNVNYGAKKQRNLICGIKNCSKPYYKKNLCQKHYNSLQYTKRRHTSIISVNSKSA